MMPWAEMVWVSSLPIGNAWADEDVPGGGGGGFGSVDGASEAEREVLCCLPEPTEEKEE